MLLQWIVQFLKSLVLMGLLLLPLPSLAKTWQYWARHVGPSEARRSEAIDALKNYEQLDKILLRQIGQKDQALALDIISAMKKESLIPKMIQKISKEPSGFLVLTLNSLISDNNSSQILPLYKQSFESSKKTLSAANIVALLEPLGRLGEVLKKDVLADLLSHDFPEVREAVLLYGRYLVLEHKNTDFHDIFYLARNDQNFQVRQRIFTYLEELKKRPLLYAKIPKLQRFQIKALPPRFKKQPIEIIMAFGYKDARPGRFVGDRHERLSFVQSITSLCQTSSQQACGFERNPKDSEVFLKKLDNGKKILLRAFHSSTSTDDTANRKNPLQTLRSLRAKTLFEQGLKSANVVFYNGHSRFGGGPDFTPPRLNASGYADAQFYKQHPKGTQAMMKTLADRHSNKGNSPLELLGIFSCASSKHFNSQLKNNGVKNYITSPRLYHYSEALNESLKQLNKYLESLSKAPN